MWGFITGLSPKKIIYGLIVIAVLIGAGMVWRAVGSYIDMQRIVEMQKLEISILHQTVEVREKQITQFKDAIEIVDAARREAEIEAENYRRLDSEIDNSKDEDDGPIAPVLRRTLDGLGGLRR